MIIERQLYNIEKNFREKENVPICFTLDAGPNVHLLYPEKYKQEVIRFIKQKLVYYCQNHLFIFGLIIKIKSQT